MTGTRPDLFTVTLLIGRKVMPLLPNYGLTCVRKKFCYLICSKTAVTCISHYHHTKKSDAKRHSRLAELVGRQHLKVSAGLLVKTRTL